MIFANLMEPVKKCKPLQQLQAFRFLSLQLLKQIFLLKMQMDPTLIPLMTFMMLLKKHKRFVPPISYAKRQSSWWLEVIIFCKDQEIFTLHQRWLATNKTWNLLSNHFIVTELLILTKLCVTKIAKNKYQYLIREEISSVFLSGLDWL